MLVPGSEENKNEKDKNQKKEEKKDDGLLSGVYETLFGSAKNESDDK